MPRRLALPLVSIEHIKQGQEIALCHLKIAFSHPSLGRLTRRAKEHVVHLQHGHDNTGLLKEPKEFFIERLRSASRRDFGKAWHFIRHPNSTF